MFGSIKINSCVIALFSVFHFSSERCHLNNGAHQTCGQRSLKKFTLSVLLVRLVQTKKENYTFGPGPQC